MAIGKQTTAQYCADLVAPVAEAQGLELWDVRFEKEGSTWYLRFFIDKEGGVDINDCENFSRAIDKIIDEADPIEQSYFLEVSSPGVERELVKPEHFLRYIGHTVNLRLIREKNGVKELRGKLISYIDDVVTIEAEGIGSFDAPKVQIAYVRLNDDFDFGGNLQ